MFGFSLDSCDILSNFVSIVPPVSAYRPCFLFDITLHSRPARTGLSRLPQISVYYSAIRLLLVFCSSPFNGCSTYQICAKYPEPDRPPQLTCNPSMHDQPQNSGEAVMFSPLTTITMLLSVYRSTSAFPIPFLYRSYIRFCPAWSLSTLSSQHLY